MNIFYPSCKATASYPKSSKLLRVYVSNKLGLKPVGCCKIKNNMLTQDDTAIILCINCERVIKKEATYKDIVYIWDIINNDPDFIFPNYHGQKMTLQHCHIKRGDEAFKELIRTLLTKMNIDFSEIEEREEDHCPSYEIMGFNIKRKLNEEEKKEFFSKKYSNVEEETIISYCKYCNDGVLYSSKNGKHILELLFPAK